VSCDLRPDRQRIAAPEVNYLTDDQLARHTTASGSSDAVGTDSAGGFNDTSAARTARIEDAIRRPGWLLPYIAGSVLLLTLVGGACPVHADDCPKWCTTDVVGNDGQTRHKKACCKADDECVIEPPNPESGPWPSPGCKAKVKCEPIADLASCPVPCSTDGSPAEGKCRKQSNDPIKSNGCGPEFLTVVIKVGVIPQGHGLGDFTEMCNQHDICYGTCNSAKKSCDDKFRKDLFAECSSKYHPNSKERCGGDPTCVTSADELSVCNRLARGYADLVRDKGQGAYNDAQKAACQCCSFPPASGAHDPRQLFPNLGAAAPQAGRIQSD
jgi:hypothetical protein